MPNAEKILDAVLRGTSDANIPFGGLCHLLTNLGFQERVKSSHHIFWKEAVAEIVPRTEDGETVICILIYLALEME